MRANNDRLYVFAGAGQYLNRIVGYASTVALPTRSAEFTQIATITESANVISVDAIYNGGAYILVTTSLQNGQIYLYVFEVATQRPAVTAVHGMYWWRVRAVNSGGGGAGSEPQSFVLRAP